MKDRDAMDDLKIQCMTNGLHLSTISLRGPETYLFELGMRIKVSVDEVRSQEKRIGSG